MPDLRALTAQPGPNDLPFDDPAIPGRPLVLRSVRPRNFTPQTPVVFVHHGVNRNGGDYRDFWLPLADEADLLVIAPEFPNESFPGSLWYNFGAREDEHGHARPREHWTYGLDGRVFSMLKDQGITSVGGYGVWGHSAGGQFVHRAMSLGFRDHVIAAVTANAGTYAMPDLEAGYPYGLAGVGMDQAALAAALTFPLTIMAGTADIDATSTHFPKEPEAMRQGETRYARAHAYYNAGLAAAHLLGVTCAWTIIDVRDVNHDGERMSAAAAPVLSRLLHSHS
jgi:poly(3-hydroxybutyrate) depolymerase